MTLRKIESGGQTGVDRAALDATLAASFRSELVGRFVEENHIEIFKCGGASSGLVGSARLRTYVGGYCGVD